MCYRGKQNLGKGDTFMDKDPSEFTDIQLTAGKLLNHKNFRDRYVFHTLFCSGGYFPH